MIVFREYHAPAEPGTLRHRAFVCVVPQKPCEACGQDYDRRNKRQKWCARCEPAMTAARNRKYQTKRRANRG